MNTEFKGTKETVHAEYRNGNEYFYFVNELKQQHFIGQMFYLGDNRQDEFKHNAELTVDAFNTIQSCGLLPSELLKQRDELRRMLEKIYQIEDSAFGLKSFNVEDLKRKIKRVLESTEV